MEYTLAFFIKITFYLFINEMVFIVINIGTFVTFPL